MNRSRITGDLVSQNNIFVDIVNDRVGIGSTIPGEKLSLPDSAKIALGNSQDLQIYHDGANSYINDSGTGVLRYLSNTHYFANAALSEVQAQFIQNGAVQLYYDGSKKFETTNTGVVVTGIVTSTSRLSVGNNTTNAVDLEFGTNRGSAGQTLANINWKWNNTNVAQIRGIAGSDTTNKDDAHLNFYTAAAGSLVERLRINSNGNVSIGNNPTVASDTLLHVEKSGETNVIFEGDTTTLGARLTLKNNNTAAGAMNQIDFADAGGQSTSSIKGFNTDQTNNYGDLAFFTRSAQGSPPAERLRITSGGAVGINESNPAAQLHVENNNANASTYYLNTDATVLIQNKNSNATAKTVLKLEVPAGGGDCAFVYGGQSTNLIFSDRQNERLRITSTGKVSIGNESSPLGTLHVKEGDSGVTSADTSQDTLFLESNGNAGLTIATPNANTGYLTFADPQDSNVGQIIYRHSDNSMSMFVNAAERLRINSDGQLIHTANKASGYIAEFHQDHASNSAQILIDSPTNSASRPSFIELSRAGTLQWSIGQGYNNSVGAFHFATSTLGSGVTGSKFSIEADGDIAIPTVGAKIYTNNSGGNLTIQGGASYPGSAIKFNGGTNGGTGVMHFYAGQSGSLEERLRIKSDGTIKIGGTAGFSETGIPLQVHNPSGTGSQMQFTGSGTGATSLSRGFRVGYNGSGGQLWNFENQYVRFATNNIERVRITSNGQFRVQNTYNGSSSTSDEFPAVNVTNLQGSYTAGNFLGGITFGKVAGHTNGVRAGILALYSNTGSENGNVGTSLVFRTASESAGDSTEKLRITSTGQLIMGTPINTAYNESAALISIAADTSAAANMLSDSSAIYNHTNPAFIHVQNRYNTGDGQEAGIIFHSKSSHNGSWAIYGKRTSSSYLSDLIFRNRTGNAASKERLRIRSNGSMFASSGSLSTTPLMELFNTDGNASTGTVLKLRTNRGQSTKDMPIFHITDGTDSSVFEVENSGRVGIFNAAPAYLLDIVNNTSDEGIRLRSTGSTYHSFYFDAARTGANQHIGRFIAKWNGNNTSMIAMNTGSDTTNKDNGHIAFCASEAGSSLVERFRCNGSSAGLVMQNDCYISIPHDEICILFDEGQKMITSNDGQGNFNIIGGKNNNAQHVSSSSGNSGIAQIEINSDGTHGNINFAVGPTRSAGSTANFEKGFKIEYHSDTSADRLNGLKYMTGSSTSPGGLASSYNVIHRGNAADGTWARVAGDGFKVLGDGGSIAITTNDGHGNCNVCWNHKDGVPDTAGSSWRIRADIDSANSHWLIQNNKSVNSGSTASMTTRFEIDENGNGYINGNSFSSDQRLKKNIKNITGATDKIKSLTGRTFEWKEELEFGEGTKYGFVAQELETVLPELVSKALVHFDKDGNIIQDNYSNKDEIVDTAKTINTVGVIPVLVEALKDALSEIDSLKARVSTLEGS